jgi:uncharacterized membrane protein YgdD (TMEM256/DUF423 family)
MPNKWIFTGAIIAALAVILGAFGAHGLQKYIETGQMTLQQLASYETAVRYQFYHAVAILIVAIYQLIAGAEKKTKISCMLFSAGIVLFSGSIYLLSLRDVIGISTWKWLGPITPLGGICFIAGWLFFALAALRHKTN